MARELNTVGVVGLGTMGAGIVEVFARNGVDVIAVEINEPALDRGRANLTASTDRAVARGKLDPGDRDALHGRVTFAVGLPALRDADLVVEAVPERLDLKRRLLAELDQVCKPTAILATNTSSLSVTEIAVATSRPGQVIGLHFFNPAPVMKLIEVIRTVVTDPDVVGDIEALCARLGKVGVSIGDRAGFIANALLFGYLNQAIGMYDARYAAREDIDAAMRLACRLPMGPLALLDLIGLDTAYEVLDTMYRRGGRDRRHAPAPLLRQMVTAGLLGRKSGRGFYTYERPGSSRLVPDGNTPDSGTPQAGTLTDGGAGPVPRTVGVVGSGPTATGLADLLRGAGYDVLTVGYDTDPGTLAPLADVDLVVEAVPDDLEVKKALFAGLDGICKPGVPLVSTTSTLPVIDIAMATGRPADVLGLRLRGPAPFSELVEVVQTIRAAPDAVNTARALCASLGKTAVGCGDRAGAIVDALLLPYLNDAVRMLETSYSTADDIDAAMKLGCGYPVGPFELLDTLGLDVALDILGTIYREAPEPGLAPAPLLRHMVTAGRLGRSTGQGFRAYGDR
ncbi:3-hydroxyacyl-CoA dehydrogenase family protein [Micromonospora sp. NBC_01813]|uniref:3-hydroxyacyl-CoA dehydrogenase family protein n=1 Tax=Micromonospora sp. NBC_01813 TaxID=2975988 RepID=UPI002DD95D6D|nr:3-hydroxybutyryl-CoA dehydrogenase [Micromonospora sp. NBC_01813]WSA08845.1 3-hydroxybutyryl-CoA dehydrogenase [Micromonospora sp. NBC_01813]